MRFADLEQWLALALIGTWLLVAVSARSRHAPWIRLSRGTLVGTGVAAVLFAAQSGVVDAVADPGPLAAADGPFLSWMIDHRTAPITAVAEVISDLGGTAAMAVLAAVVAGLLWWRGHRREAAVLVVATAGAAVLVEGFKHLYGRARPPASAQLITETNFSLPSGHSLGSIVVLGVIAAVVVRLTDSTVVRTSAIALASVAVAVIGLSRLYLGVHWLTDVLTGWLLGATWLALCMTILLRSRQDERSLHSRIHHRVHAGGNWTWKPSPGRSDDRIHRA